MKSIFIFLILLCSITELTATHIVGGEIQMQYLNNNNRYRFIVNLYFDQINGNAQAEDASIVLAIYRRRNNQLVQSFTLNKSSQAFVQYQGSDCQQQFLNTRLIRYLADVDLNPNNYRETEGYYAVWERCCRNNVVNNIVASGDAGNTFYLWFPAIQQGGQPFRNNTPAFSIPAGDYLCLGKDFSTTNFAATDADGDQLVYSMVTPFNGYSNRNNPDPFNGGNVPNMYSFPPPTINWAAGFSATNAITSAVGKPLSIDANTGELSVNPNRTGLFVFSIRCEEFRDGVKIGEVRRDFQFLVRECKENFPPQISIPLPSNPSQNYQEGDTLTIDANSNNLCFDVKVKDAPRENIKSIVARKVSGNYNFRSSPLSINSIRTDNNGDAIIQFCWIKCLYSKDETDLFIFEIIAKDDACPFEGVDTLRVKLRVLPKFNSAPQLNIIRATSNVNVISKTISAKVNEPVEMVFEGTDTNNDELILEALINGEPVDLLGFQFIDSIKVPGRVVSRFYWLPDCRTIKQNGEIQEYLIDFVLKEENNECDETLTKISFKLTLIDDAVDIGTFIPANAFTPNGDGVNDFFTLPNLPVENCYYRFANIKIYNRWGKKVFEADNKNFAWSGDIFPAGVYYYIIDYTNALYKGTVSILK